ncbi:C39 family peptidase [Caulobacter sp. 17J65-9]|nr:C39 family peptidase [Caulobacter sp. 17J65-9]
MRQDKVVVQKYDLSCGAAALATVLNYQHGDPVTEKEIARGLIKRKEYIEHPELVRIREGFSLLDLKRYVEARGYEGIGYGKLGLKDLVENAPILTPMNFIGYNHFVVVTGVRDGTVFFADPAFGNRTMPIDAFEHAWIDNPKMGRVGFVVKRRDGQEPPNQLGANETILLPPESVLRRAVSPLSR